MDLILWRHAEAEDEREGLDDLARALTPKGRKQAARVGAWLDGLLPEEARILCSPAVRCEQTAQALGRKYKLRQELAPNHPVSELLAAANWPSARQTVVVVGHQPVLGQAIAQLLGVASGSCAVRKGAAWWLRVREREGERETVVVAVQSPDVA